jgi:hypothetical protein
VGKRCGGESDPVHLTSSAYACVAGALDDQNISETLAASLATTENEQSGGKRQRLERVTTMPPPLPVKKRGGRLSPPVAAWLRGVSESATRGLGGTMSPSCWDLATAALAGLSTTRDGLSKPRGGDRDRGADSDDPQEKSC